MTLLALICPHCATGLDAAEERRILVCGNCHKTWSVPENQHRLVELERTLVRPQQTPQDGAELILLPMWEIGLRRELLGAVGSSLPERILVPAVGVQRLPAVVQFARNLTRAPLEWAAWDVEEAPCESAEITAEDAYVLAETVVLRHLDRWPDDASLPNLEIPLGSARLLDWPCARFGSEIVDLVGGLSVHRALTESSALSDHAAALARAIQEIGLGADAGTRP